jgi:hypothetical protein
VDVRRILDYWSAIKGQPPHTPCDPHHCALRCVAMCVVWSRGRSRAHPTTSRPAMFLLSFLCVQNWMSRSLRICVCIVLRSATVTRRFMICCSRMKRRLRIRAGKARAKERAEDMHSHRQRQHHTERHSCQPRTILSTQSTSSTICLRCVVVLTIASCAIPRSLALATVEHAYASDKRTLRPSSSWIASRSLARCNVLDLVVELHNGVPCRSVIIASEH